MRRRGSGPWWRTVAAGVGLLALVSAVDYVTGYESLFFIFYYLPVALYAWFLSESMAEIMALASAVVWWIVDRVGGHPYPHELYRLWNALTCFAAFWLVAWAVAQIRERLEKQRRLNVALAETLEAHKRATEEIRRLQGQIQTISASTKRIRVGDQWVAIEDFLSTRLGIQVAPDLSEPPAEESRRQIDGPAR